MIVACPSRYVGSAEPLILQNQHGQTILFISDGSGSWGNGVEAAAWFREWFALNQNAERVTPATVTSTLQAGIRELPQSISNDAYGWSFSIVIVIIDENMIQVGCCGGLAVTAVSDESVCPLFMPARLIDELVARGDVLESEAEKYKFSRLIGGPFFGPDCLNGVEELHWVAPIVRSSYALVAVGDPALPRYLDTFSRHDLLLTDPIALRDAVEVFGKGSAPTAIITQS